MENKYYVYCLTDNSKKGVYVFGGYEFSYEPFYIGKGSNDRVNQHFEPNQYKLGRTYKERKIRKLLSEGNIPGKLIIKSGLTETEAFELEIDLIRLIGRKPNGLLTNGTNGGDGTSGHVSKNKGKTFEEIHGMGRALELKKYLSNLTRGKKLEEIHGMSRALEIKNKIKLNTPNHKGIKHSIETRKKISESLIGNNRHKGCKHSVESREKISESKKGIISWNAQTIQQLDKDDNIINEWRSGKYAAEQLGLSQGNIWSVINGDRKTCGGYKWVLKKII